MTPIEDFWPRVVGTFMWALATLAGALLTLLQVAMVVGIVWGLIKIII